MENFEGSGWWRSRMGHRIAGWGRRAGGRWGVMRKRHSKPNLRLVVFVVLLVLLVISGIVYRRDALRFAGREMDYHAQLPGRLTGEGELFRCDRSQFRTDICNMRGDIRIYNRSIVLYSKDPTTAPGVQIVKPYTRKWEQSCMDTVHEVTLRSVPTANGAVNPKPPACDVKHKVPGVVFSNGGYTGNLYHEFHDGLIPLFITSQHLHREVVFIISEFHDWWLTKYIEVVQQLSKYEIVDLINDTRVHCFPEIEAGLHIHDELAIDPDRMPHHETIQDFRAILNRGYTPNKELPSAPPLGVSKSPSLTIIVRNGTRRFLNLDGIVKTAEQLGFNVNLLIPDPTMELKHIFRLLNSSDVLLGVHGAAMTHFLFMRPGTVFIQVVPLGTDWAARTYYGEPSIKLGLHYLPLTISPQESSLSEKYNLSDPILRNPDEVLERRGWWSMKEIFLEGQDVQPSLERVRTTLNQALEKLRGSKVRHPIPR
ncbi:hypothetical protein KC19_10G045000 [Ceratodon purpureus]|uniref:Glycosyltransferase 61 catalytic domain-containing protein n=1 Tax=Ceratodon purpureus TaxID=3225 RepID=A0A8T0GJE3_CERPU|nr:hypothetical protein KC19_10G045000 [Ceratodon purpureus]